MESPGKAKPRKKGKVGRPRGPRVDVEITRQKKRERDAIYRQQHREELRLKRQAINRTLKRVNLRPDTWKKLMELRGRLATQSVNDTIKLLITRYDEDKDKHSLSTEITDKEETQLNRGCTVTGRSQHKVTKVSKMEKQKKQNQTATETKAEIEKDKDNVQETTGNTDKEAGQMDAGNRDDDMTVITVKEEPDDVDENELFQVAEAPFQHAAERSCADEVQESVDRQKTNQGESGDGGQKTVSKSQWECPLCQEMQPKLATHLTQKHGVTSKAFQRNLLMMARRNHRLKVARKKVQKRRIQARKDRAYSHSATAARNTEYQARAVNQTLPGRSMAKAATERSLPIEFVDTREDGGHEESVPGGVTGQNNAHKGGGNSARGGETVAGVLLRMQTSLEKIEQHLGVCAQFITNQQMARAAKKSRRLSKQTATHRSAADRNTAVCQMEGGAEVATEDSASANLSIESRLFEILTENGQVVHKEIFPGDLELLKQRSLSVQNFAVQLARRVFTQEERVSSNCGGFKKLKLDATRLKNIPDATVTCYNIPEEDVGVMWKKCRIAIDSSCRKIGGGNRAHKKNKKPEK